MTHIPAASRVWSPDAPPLVPHADNDEFNGVALAGAWTELDNQTKITPVVGNGHLTLDVAPTSPDCVGGVFKAVPVGSEYALVTLAGVQHVHSAQGIHAGLMLAGNLTASPTTAPIVTYSLAQSALGAGPVTVPSFMQVLNCTDFDTIAGALLDAFWYGTHAYLRLRVNGTTVAFDVSLNGRSWGQIFTHTIGFTPVKMGLSVVNGNASKSARFDFFRVFEGAGTSAIGATRIGRQVNLSAVD